MLLTETVSVVFQISHSEATLNIKSALLVKTFKAQMLSLTVIIRHF